MHDLKYDEALKSLLLTDIENHKTCGKSVFIGHVFNFYPRLLETFYTLPII